MEPWRTSWRAIQKHLPTIGLEALRNELLQPSGKLLGGEFFGFTYEQMLLPATCDGPIIYACAIGYTIWKAGWERFAEAEIELFCKILIGVCEEDFIEWFDEHPPSGNAGSIAP